MFFVEAIVVKFFLSLMLRFVIIPAAESNPSSSKSAKLI